MASTLSIKRTWTAASVLLAVTLSVAGCAADETSAAKPSSSPRAEVDHAKESAPQKARFQVTMEGTLTRLFAARTLRDFARQDEVSNVIRGTVLATRATVSQPGNVVETILTVAVREQREDGPTEVKVREQGGVVSVADVRSDFEEKTGRRLKASELKEKVNFQFAGSPHAEVGDDVLLIVADDEAGSSADYAGLVRLEASDTATDGAQVRKAAAATYTWPGESPNPGWDGSIDAAALLN